MAPRCRVDDASANVLSLENDIFHSRSVPNRWRQRAWSFPEEKTRHCSILIVVPKNRFLDLWWLWYIGGCFRDASWVDVTLQATFDSSVCCIFFSPSPSYFDITKWILGGRLEKCGRIASRLGLSIPRKLLPRPYIIAASNVITRQPRQPLVRPYMPLWKELRSYSKWFPCLLYMTSKSNPAAVAVPPS